MSAIETYLKLLMVWINLMYVQQEGDKFWNLGRCEGLLNLLLLPFLSFLDELQLGDKEEVLEILVPRGQASFEMRLQSLLTQD